MALIIGNADYNANGELDLSDADEDAAKRAGFLPDLANPIRDAQDIRDALRNLGFDVSSYKENATRVEMITLLDNFGKKVVEAGPEAIVFVYYSGHGMQIEGENYLLPSGAQLQGTDFSSMSATAMQAILSGVATPMTLLRAQFKPRAGNGVNIVVLDACRNNPWDPAKRGNGGRGRGLADQNWGLGQTLIAFSTEPGNTAYDGDPGDRNSPYTAALKQRISLENVDLFNMFNNVSRSVESRTLTWRDGPQRPWINSVTVPEVCLAGCSNVSTAPRRADISAIWAKAKAGQLPVVPEGQGLDALQSRLITWAQIRSGTPKLSFQVLDRAVREMAGWPGEADRRAKAEQALFELGAPPEFVIAWFGQTEPSTNSGIFALASALEATGRDTVAAEAVRTVWREAADDPLLDSEFLEKFRRYLNSDDHWARFQSAVLQGSTARARQTRALLSPDKLSTADYALALHERSRDLSQFEQKLTPAQRATPFLQMLQLRRLRIIDRPQEAVAILTSMSTAQIAESDSMSEALCSEVSRFTPRMLREGKAADAYRLLFTTSASAVPMCRENLWKAGWVALTQIKNVQAASDAFQVFGNVADSPFSISRALYWRGRVAEARGEQEAATRLYTSASRNITTFYGLLSAEKLGVREVELPKTPLPTPGDRASFEAREIVQATKLVGELEDSDAFSSFVAAGARVVSSPQEFSLLAEIAIRRGDVRSAVRVGKFGLSRGFVVAEAFPIDSRISEAFHEDAAYAHAIVRQESEFDPTATSSVGALGLFQVLPSTARVLMRESNETYSRERLLQPEVNIRIGATQLRRYVGSLGNSILLSSAASNAGEARISQWVADCGNPTSGSMDPINFIECIPFSETRNYVQRVMESRQVYRALLGGGKGPLTLSADLKRGRYAASASANSPLPTDQ